MGMMSPRPIYQLDVLVQGFPGKTLYHGGLGWSTVALLRSGNETILVDTGGYAYRELLDYQLKARGLQREDITSVVVTHLHWDHVCNYTLFPRARVFVPNDELDWASQQAVGTWFLPEFHVERLACDPNVVRVHDRDEFLPGVVGVAVPGHTPGSMAYIAGSLDGSIIVAGDAVKNLAELTSERADLTLDPTTSADSIRRIRTIALAEPTNLLVFGHDRVMSFERGVPVAKQELRASITARLTESFDSETLFELDRPLATQ